MKLKELEQRCGDCKCIDYCTDPFEDLCLCCDSRFSEITDEEYKEKAKTISIKNDKRKDETGNEYIARKVYEKMRQENLLESLNIKESNMSEERKGLIPAEERQPDGFYDVLIYNDNKKFTIGYYNGKKWYESYTKNVLHPISWKPLPETNQEKKIHYKKLTQPFFNDVWYGKKKFELRKNDCNYQVGDEIVLKEYDPKHDEYIGRSISAHIIYILKDFDGLKEGYCILGIGDIEKRYL